MMAPDAGSSTAVSNNRGHVFIPEVGDQVMVGFVHGHPDRPYVLGGMFHGLNGIGGSSNNAVKSIMTRSGHTIKFDDSDENLGITIKDKNENIIHLDTKGKNIEITAPETISINAKNINITAKENIVVNANANFVGTSGNNMNLSAGNNFLASADKEYMLSADKSIVNIEQESFLTAKNIEETAEKIISTSTKEDMLLKSIKKVNVQSSDKVNMF
jgi:uncharacterized protein involved in type VI secretion and phage assembly